MIGLITGAARGLGYELVKLGLEKGYTMIAACNQIPLADSKLAILKKEYADQLVLMQMDVTEEGQAKEAAQAIETANGKIDFLINNAGVLLESKYDKSDAVCELDIQMLRRTIEVNTIGPAIVLKYFMPLLYQSAHPCVMTITSEAGNLTAGGYNYLAYSVSKYAVNMYTQKIRNYLKEEKSERKVRVYMVHPGRMQTEMGIENAQIEPSEAAAGIFEILDNGTGVEMEIPFINYKGEAMPY